ncbi:MAG: hypothetical protein K8R69_00695 [Deltaproteobacteria bacterium]|nr:hypothetical protein [Deltaproteobacteria bacterium]
MLKIQEAIDPEGFRMLAVVLNHIARGPDCVFSPPRWFLFLYYRHWSAAWKKSACKRVWKTPF